jgi:hypothetical protein
VDDTLTKPNGGFSTCLALDEKKQKVSSQKRGNQ